MAPLDWLSPSSPSQADQGEHRNERHRNEGGTAPLSVPANYGRAKVVSRENYLSVFFFTHTHTEREREDEVQQYPGGRVEEGRRREVLQGTGEARVVFRPFASAGGEG